MSEEFKRAFETKEEFMKFYEEHKTEIDKLNTKQLNSVYKIKDCKISKNKKKLIVKPDVPSIKKPVEEDKEAKPVEDKPVVNKPKQEKNKPKQKEIKPENLEKMINHIITEYEKQLSNLKELKNKLVSDNLYESETSKDIQTTTHADKVSLSEAKDIPIAVSQHMD